MLAASSVPDTSSELFRHCIATEDRDVLAALGFVVQMDQVSPTAVVSK